MILLVAFLTACISNTVSAKTVVAINGDTFYISQKLHFIGLFLYFRKGGVDELIRQIEHELPVWKPMR